MAVRRMVFAVALAGLAMAKPIKPIKPPGTFCPIICIDAISDCGVPYGGYCIPFSSSFLLLRLICFVVLTCETVIVATILVSTQLLRLFLVTW